VVRFVDALSGQTVGPELKPAMMSILNGRALAFSPDGKRLAVGSTENFGQDSRFFRSRIFRFEATGDNDWRELPVTTWQDGIIKAMRFSPNGDTLTAIADQVREWNWAAGTNLPRGGGAVDVLASGPNSRAFGGWIEKDKTSTITVMGRDAYLPAMPKWPSHLGCLAVSPDGALVAAGNKSTVADPSRRGSDLPWEKRAAIRVWDTRTGAERAVLLGHASWILDLAFSPDGKELISTSNDGTVRTWKLP
jgi:WD40 repeat protein